MLTLICGLLRYGPKLKLNLFLFVLDIHRIVDTEKTSRVLFRFVVSDSLYGANGTS
jgi:hypothetical protein